MKSVFSGIIDCHRGDIWPDMVRLGINHDLEMDAVRCITGSNLCDPARTPPPARACRSSSCAPPRSPCAACRSSGEPSRARRSSRGGGTRSPRPPAPRTRSGSPPWPPPSRSPCPGAPDGSSSRAPTCLRQFFGPVHLHAPDERSVARVLHGPHELLARLPQSQRLVGEGVRLLDRPHGFPGHAVGEAGRLACGHDMRRVVMREAAQAAAGGEKRGVEHGRTIAAAPCDMQIIKYIV